MELLLLAFMLVAATPYWLAPVRIHRRQRQRARPAFEPFDAAKHLIDQRLVGALQQNVASLEREGFRQVADLFRQDPATRTRVILLDTQGEDLALVIGISPTRKPASGLCSIELVARFDGDRSLSVSNTPLPGPFPQVPGRDKVRLPAVRDPAQLYRVFQALVARRYGAARRAPPEYRGDPTGFLADAMTRELRQQVDTGYYWWDATADAYRPTWKGAFLMCWKLTQPFRDIREWSSDRRAQALLRELGFAERAAPAAPRRAPSHWNWIAIVAGVLFFLIHPRVRVFDRGLSGLSRSTAARDSLPAGFTVPTDFPGAVQALERLVGAGSAPLVVRDSVGRSVRTNGVVVPVEAARAEGLITAAQDSFLARGFYLFRVAEHFGIKGHPDTLALYPSRDGYALVRLMGTNGANYDIGPDSIVAWLEGLEREQPLVLTGIGFDWVAGRFTTPLADPDSLARRFNAFCPDIVTQGTGSVAALARELRRSGELYCWWD